MGHNPPQQCCIKLSNVGTDGPLPNPRRPPPITWCNVGIVGCWDQPRMQPSLSLCVISTHISTIVPISQLRSSRIKLRTGSDTPPPPWFNPVETILAASSNQKSPKLKTAGVVVHASRAGARKAQWPIFLLNGSQGKERGVANGHNNKRNFELPAKRRRGSLWSRCFFQLTPVLNIPEFLITVSPCKNVADETNLSTCVNILSATFSQCKLHGN